MSETMDTYVPTREEIDRRLASLAKAWPVLAEHASHIDGEFDLALSAVRRMLDALHEDAARLDWVERHATRVQSDGMDGWSVHGRLVTEGLRIGYPVHGAHRLREAIDAAMQADGGVPRA